MTRLRDLDDAAFRAAYDCGRFDATVLANRFTYLLDHMCSRLLACAFSPVLRDFYDFAATLTGPPDIDWPTPVVSKSLAAFTGTMMDAVRTTITEYGLERLGEGDVIIANDPYRIGTHVNDLLFIRPVFFEGRLSGFVNIKAHQLDMGGSVPGGFSAAKTNVYENGLVLSPRALMKAGAPVAESWSLIFDNVRFAELLRLDMQTIVACLDLGERMMIETLERYGRPAMLGAMRYVCDADAERIGDAIARLPDGDWRGEALLDCDGMDASEEYPVRCAIRKRGRRMEIDLSGTARQARTSINGTWADTKSTVGIVLKYLFDPDGRWTSGCYRDVDIVLPDGAICSALPPDGVVFAYGESTNGLVVAMFEAIAGALGQGAVAGDMGSPNMHSATGVTPHGQPWISMGIGGGERGGWGATRAGDADNYTTFYQANGIDPALEVAEAETPVVVMRREYVADSGGPGLNRGGATVLKDSLWQAPTDHHLFILRFKKATGVGVQGGQDGAPGGVWLWPAADGKPAQIGADDYAGAVAVGGRINAATNRPDPAGPWSYFGREKVWKTDAGATFRYLTNGGGGWGDPLARAPDRVLRDVRDGYVSVAGAARDYGVAVIGDPDADPEGLRIDAAETARLREARRAA